MNICWVFVWSWYEQSDVLKHVYSSVLQAVVKAVVMQDFRDWVWVRVRIAKKRSSTFILFLCWVYYYIFGYITKTISSQDNK